MSAHARFDLAGRVALVTGASSGIGEATAQALAEAGADVVLGVRSPGRALALSERIETLGRRCLVVAMDVTDPDACERAMDAAVADMGGVHVLVNNAGGGIEAAALDVGTEDFDTSMATNVKAPYFLSQGVARHLVPHVAHALAGEIPRAASVPSANAPPTATPSVRRSADEVP